MATTTINTRLALKTDISANWENSSLVLLKGEPAIEITDSGAFKFKFGDGVKTFSELPYATLSPTEISSLITDGAVQSVSISSGDSNGQIAITVDGTKTNASVKGLGSAAFTNSNAYATASHSHAIANVTGLQMALDGKAASTHTHDDRYYTEAEVNTKLAGKANSSHTHGSGDITSLDASKLTGTISIDRLPAGALERCVIVETDADRLKLTTASVQKGDTVKVTGTGKMYFVIDDTKLTSEDGYTVYTAGSATSVPWSGVTGKPNTFTPSSHTHTKSQITDFPTSLPASDVYGWAKASSKPSYTKSEVGLGNVDNTADANKSVKYAGSSGSSNTVVYTALTNTDLNTLQTEGRWYYAGGGNTCTNIPVASAAFELYVGRNASGWRYQQFTVTSGEIYIRVFDSSNWGSWKKLAFTSDTVTAASSVPWSGITGKPSTFAPSSHNHTIANITDIGKASVNFANYSGYPQGFSSRTTTATWGNQTGTVVTDWHTSGGGDIAFRDNSGQLNVVIDGFFYQNEGKNLVLDSGNYSNYAAAKSHTHTISNITNLQSTLDGKSNTNHTHDLNSMINTLTNGTSDPVDTDYYIAQYAGGGSTTTTYHRRPHSALWNYIKSKANSVYQPKGSYAASSHTHDDRYYTESEINTKLASKSDTSHKHNYVVGSYTGNGGQQKPNYFGTNKVGFLMMNTTVNGDSNYKDWIIMDCYNGNDVGGSVALGVNRQKLAAYIMRSAAERSSWAESAELLHTQNYTSYTVTKTGSGASGTWGISISGNAASASSVPWSGITGKPSSMPASDVYAWAKASTKPSYSWSEIGSKPSTFTPSSHTHNYLAIYGSRPADINFKTSTNGAGAMFHFVSTSSTKTGKPPEDSNVLQMNWDNNGGWDTQFAISNGSSPHSYIRSQNNGTWGNWTTLLDSSNYNNYSPSKTGGGASGTWGINITGASGSCTGNAASASKVNGHTVNSDVPSGAKFTDTNTWRGIQNNLTSDSTSDSLSAAQGKVLKGLVDGKAASNHNHDSTYSKLNHTHSYLPLSGGTISGTVNTNGLCPNATKVHDIGSSSKRYNYLYVDQINACGSIGVFNDSSLSGEAIKMYSVSNNGTMYGSLRFSQKTSSSTSTITLLPNRSGTASVYIQLPHTAGIVQVSTSDARMKNNIKDAEVSDALSLINSIKLHSFDWRQNKKHQSIGFIADELEKLDNNLAVGNNNNELDENGLPLFPKCVNTFYLQGYEVKAIQELSQKNQQLENIIALLQKKLTELENKI